MCLLHVAHYKKVHVAHSDCPIERDAKNLPSFICEVVLGTVGIGRNHTRAIGVSWGLVPLSATSQPRHTWGFEWCVQWCAQFRHARCSLSRREAV